MTTIIKPILQMSKLSLIEFGELAQGHPLAGVLARTQPRQCGAKAYCLTTINNQTSYHSHHILLLEFAIFLTYSKVNRMS